MMSWGVSSCQKVLYSTTSSSRSGVSLRLMPLGGSITYGQGSSDGNGYRDVLRRLLLDAGYSVHMVGSRKAGMMQDNANEGWRGSRIEQITSKAKRSIQVHMPNLVTINAGSNDCLQGFELEHAGERMDSLLEYIWTASPGSTIILSSLLVNADMSTQSRICSLNERFKRLAEQKLAAHRKIVFVDMQGEAGPQVSELTDDGTHPHDEGYRKIAMIWFAGIQEAVQKGFIEAPPSSLADDSPHANDNTVIP